jgi:hypothetical protein
MTRQPRHRPPGHGADDGQITIFVLVMTAALILVAGLVLDGGLTLAARERALGEAQQAARAGAQAINLATYRRNGTLAISPTQAAAGARRYLTDTGYHGSVQVTGNVVTVEVTTTQPMQILAITGLRAITVHATASATPERGITTELP